MSANSVSDGWRVKGNYSYRNYQQSNDIERQKSYLQLALKSYYRAFETAENSDEKSSASKNCALALWRLATVLHLLKERLTQVEFHFCEAIKYFSKAALVGRQCKPSEWISDLDQSYGMCVDCGIEFGGNYSEQGRISALERYVSSMCEESHMVKCFFDMANVLSQAGCSAVGNKDFISALRAFHDCYRPVQECFRLSKEGSEIFKEASIMEQDIVFHLATAEALQAIKIGDDTLKAAVENEEGINMSMIYDAMDRYKSAVVATREIEVEMEAIALSRLGSLFDKVLKIKSKAREYFKTSILLANSLHPRTFGTETWFKTCVEVLQRYQAEDKHNDEPVRQEQRSECLKELETELKDIDSANVGATAAGFLRHIYRTYPPKNSEHRLDEESLEVKDDERKTMKKILLTAIQHYHPDKQDKEKFGLKWAVLCEEITKILNQRYEPCKGL